MPTRTVISGEDTLTPRHIDKTRQDAQPVQTRQRFKDWQKRIAAMGGSPGTVTNARLKERQDEYERIPIVRRKGFKRPGSQTK